MSEEGMEELSGKVTYNISLKTPTGGPVITVNGNEQEVGSTIEIANNSVLGVIAGQTEGEFSFNVSIDGTSYSYDIPVNVVENPNYAKELSLPEEDNPTIIVQGKNAQIVAIKNPEDSTDILNWDITSGGQYASISQTGLVTANADATIGAIITIKVSVERTDGTETTVLPKTISLTVKEPKQIVTATQKDNYTDNNGDKATIPAGFRVSDNEREQTIANGLVITDEKSEFVWIPVPNVIWDKSTTPVTGSYTPIATTYTYNSKTYYRGMLYTFEGITSTYQDGDSVGTTSYREPSLVTNSTSDLYAPMTSVSGSSYDAKSNYYSSVLGLSGPAAFGSQMQSDFDEMVKSIDKYKGFYIGKYETSLTNASASSAGSSSSVQSKAGVIPATDNISASMYWYRLYKLQRNYSTSSGHSDSTTSSMMWGCQNHAMLNFALTNSVDKNKVTATGNAEHNYSGPQKTGNAPKDKICNIYDLEGNVMEWCLTARGHQHRATRGGDFDSSISPSSRNYVWPTDTKYKSGSRITLCIK